MEQRLDAVERARNRVQPADTQAAARQGHIERLAGELLREPKIDELFAPAVQRGPELLRRRAEGTRGRRSWRGACPALSGAQ
jgi:hypothetical protein